MDWFLKIGLIDSLSSEPTFNVQVAPSGFYVQSSHSSAERSPATHRRGHSVKSPKVDKEITDSLSVAILVIFFLFLSLRSVTFAAILSGGIHS